MILRTFGMFYYMCEFSFFISTEWQLVQTQEHVHILSYISQEKDRDREGRTYVKSRKPRNEAITKKDKHQSVLRYLEQRRGHQNRHQ